jgi:hypothetical protein
MIRFACFRAFFVAFALAGPAWGAGGCGVGCSTTSEGACVRDGWQQGLPVRNECPATSRPSPPCGPDLRWSRKSMSCILR